jgi:hypothetical protein
LEEAEHYVEALSVLRANCVSVALAGEVRLPDSYDRFLEAAEPVLEEALA